MKKRKQKKDQARRAVSYSRFYGGKVAVTPKVPIRSLDDFAIWYTPGVAAVSEAVGRNSELSFEYTNRWNTIAIVTDGSRVLGLGKLGPEASLPVMEGKSLIYKFLGGVDAYPLPLRVKDDDQFATAVESLEPSLGGVNLEDIESPRCFGLLERLRKEMSIPVWHDDQQGTAGVILAALYNSLKLTGRELKGTRITFLGAGAANIAAARLVIQAGCNPADIVMLDSKGILHSEREDIDQLLLRNRWKAELALTTNGSRLKGGLSEALKGADVLVAAAGQGPGLVKRGDIALMNRRAIVFALANPVPEIWPAEALAAGAEIVATGRSDFPNQVNNSLLFPAVFRGALDVRASTITDAMVIEAARELAGYASETGLTKTRILPSMLEWEVYPRVAAAVGIAAQREGVARKKLSSRLLYSSAKEMIQASRRTLKVLMRSGVILPPPK